MIVYKRDGLWFWMCPNCRWFEGAYKTQREADRDADAHECRRPA